MSHMASVWEAPGRALAALGSYLKPSVWRLWEAKLLFSLCILNVFLDGVIRSVCPQFVFVFPVFHVKRIQLSSLQEISKVISNLTPHELNPSLILFVQLNFAASK